MRKGSQHSEASRAKLRVAVRNRTRRDPLERFNEKVNLNGPIVRPELGHCHIWTGKHRHGHFPYGQFYFNGRIHEAHRWILEQAHGPLPEGQCALHRCDNPSCVRLDHLFAGTRRDNFFDMYNKGRHRPGRGERQRDAKLTYEDADLIRWCHRAGHIALWKIAFLFDVGETTIGRVIHDQTWVRPLAA
jgi:hypothetical protein